MSDAFEIRPGLIGQYVDRAPVPGAPWLHLHAADAADEYDRLLAWRDVGAVIEFCCHVCAASELVIFERYRGWPLVTSLCMRAPFMPEFAVQVERLVRAHKDCAELSIFDKLRSCPTERELVMVIDLRVPGAAAAVAVGG